MSSPSSVEDGETPEEQTDEPKTDGASMNGFNYHVDQFLEMMVDNGASDLIIKAGAPPAYRINDDIRKVDMDFLKPDQVEKLARDFMHDEQIKRVTEHSEEYDGSYSLSGVGRFRVNVYLQRESLGMVFRHVRHDIRNFQELNLPPSIEKLPNFKRGLVLVTGTTSSGKSTTLAAMIDYINERLNKHIVTIEDPIEFLHRDKQSIISQREIGVDTQDYSTALKYMMRQNPDIILIGEMRDEETIKAAFKAAETGHLVFSTLHTNTAAQTVDRLIEFFPPKQQDQIRTMLADYLQGICSQRMCVRADTDGIVPAIELLFKNPTIKKLIKENRISKIRSAIHQGETEGMQTFDQSLVDLYHKDMISKEEAKRHCSKPENFELYVDDHWPDVDTGVLGDRGGPSLGGN